MTTITRTDALADALERFDGYAYLDAPGFAFHGPMGAETLSVLGHDDLVASWAESYKARHQPLEAPPTTSRLAFSDEPTWRAALGDMSRVSDWAAMFQAELNDQPWPTVLRRWVPILLPGSAGAMGHGLLRTAHSVRALPSEGDTPSVLLDEAARGLALWAATFKPLPGHPGLHGTLDLPIAIAKLPRPNPPWSMFEAGGFARLDELPTFPGAVEALGPPDSIDAAFERSHGRLLPNTRPPPGRVPARSGAHDHPGSRHANTAAARSRDHGPRCLRAALAHERGDHHRLHHARHTDRPVISAVDAVPHPMRSWPAPSSTATATR